MPQGFEAGHVSAARLLCPKVRNVTIAAESLAGFTFEPGADVGIRLPRCDSGADERHYSVWKSTAEGKFDLCVVLHGLGPGSRWAERCAVGDPVEISRSPRPPDRSRPLGRSAPAFRRRDLDRVGRGPDPSVAGGGGRARVLRGRLDGAPLARAQVTRPEAVAGWIAPGDPARRSSLGSRAKTSRPRTP